ncbi:hypothetical protein [Cryptosporangium minutisporangium]|uniref:Uncharacterized protein n=1 Tax=Cryptosporangium minutisporangium TaxID=113569 RepID=A0ABP6T649_9ACTN
MTEPSTRPDNTSDGPTLAGGPYLGGPGNDAGYTAGLPRPGHADEIPDSDDAAKDTIAAAGAAPASAATTPATDAARETDTGEAPDDEPGADVGAVNPS